MLGEPNFNNYVLDRRISANPAPAIVSSVEDKIIEAVAEALKLRRFETARHLILALETVEP